MLHGSHPLREKMTLFWHNHFATSIIKVQTTALMLKQNELLRRHALGKFGPFLLDMSKDPAMLIWLDSNSNVTGKPNENYAREIMELFSLGVGHYTEKDIREAARAFTGWHTDRATQLRASSSTPTCTTTATRPSSARPATGTATTSCASSSNSRPPPASWSASSIASSSARRPSRPTALLEPLADVFRKSDYDIALLVRTMLASRHFFSGPRLRQRIKSPVEYVLGAVQATAAWA